MNDCLSNQSQHDSANLFASLPLCRNLSSLLNVSVSFVAVSAAASVCVVIIPFPVLPWSRPLH